MESSRIQLWKCRFPLVPHMKIKEEPKESLDCIEPIGEEYNEEDFQMLQEQDNERITNEVSVPENQIPHGQYDENIVNERVIPEIQIPQGSDYENFLNSIAIQNQIPHGKKYENNLNEDAVSEIHITKVQHDKNFVNENSIPANQIPHSQHNENLENTSFVSKIQLPQGINNETIVNENWKPKYQILPSLFNENVLNEISILANQIPQGKDNENNMNEVVFPQNQIQLAKYYKNILNKVLIPENQMSQGKDNENIVNKIAHPENLIPLDQYEKSILKRILSGQYNNNIVNESKIPENQKPHGQYNRNIENKVLIPEKVYDNDVVKCRIKGCICTNPYTTPYMNRSYPKQKHLPRLTRIRRPFMNSSSPRRRHLPRLTRIKLPPLKRIKPLPLESGNNKLISNLPQPNATPLIISTQEIIHRIVQKNYKNDSMNANVNPIGCNQNLSREVNKVLGKRKFRKSVSMMKRKNSNLPSQILHKTKDVHSEIFGTVFEYSKKNLVTNRIQGIYRCIECGYRSKYSHHIKHHIKSHNFEQNKENKNKIPTCNIYENNQMHSLDKVKQTENKNSHCSIQPTISKSTRNKNQWQKCPLCLYISNSVIALTKHIHLSHKTQLKKRSYALYIKGDTMIENNLSQNYCLRNDSKEKKIVTKELRNIRKEVCTLCDFNTYSLSELNSHLRSHIPYEFAKENIVEKSDCDNPTFSTSVRNPKNENIIDISENAGTVDDKTNNISRNKYGIKRNPKRLKISEFFPILDLNISNKIPENIENQENNEILIVAEFNNKQSSEIKKTCCSDRMVNNDNVEEERLLYDFIRFDDKKVSKNISDVEEHKNSDYSDTEIDCEVDYEVDYEGQDNFQPTAEFFKNPIKYLSKENSRKSMFIDKFTDFCKTTKTTDNGNIDNFKQNPPPDLSSKLNDKVDEFNHLPSPLYRNGGNYSFFESKNIIKEMSNFTGTNNEKGDSICLECSACFKNPWDYKRHIKRSHKKCNECSPEQECVYNSSKEYPVIMKTKSFECSECSYASITKGSFVRHMQTHSIEKQFECNICGYHCTGGGELQRHIWVHKGGGKHLNFWPQSNFL